MSKQRCKEGDKIRPEFARAAQLAAVRRHTTIPKRARAVGVAT